MQLDLLQTFLILSEELSFTRAATSLELSQPSVSRKIKQLEEDLGLALIVRGKHRVTLTHEGKQLRQSLEPLLREIKESLRKWVSNTIWVTKGTNRVKAVRR